VEVKLKIIIVYIDLIFLQSNREKEEISRQEFQPLE
jgi:hypothetical protein